MDSIKEKVDRAKETITDDTSRMTLQYKWINIILCLVALVMSIINVCTKEWVLCIATTSFSILVFINVILVIFGGKKGLRASEILLEIDMMLLFLYFIINGGTNGFSIIWVLVIPSAGMLLFGRLKGTLLSTAIFLSMIIDFIVISILEIPEDVFVYEYSSTFKLRFPVVYIALYLVSFLFETIRLATHNELKKTRLKYEELYKKDALTGLLNRHGFNEAISIMVKDRNLDIIAFQIFDIDHFKNVNDTYGHISGDLALKQVAGIVQDVASGYATVYRWGGEEFALLYYDGSKAKEIAKAIHQKLNESDIILVDDVKIKITASSGLVLSKHVTTDMEFGELISKADENLYNAKENGRNRVCYLDLINNSNDSIVL